MTSAVIDTNIIAKLVLEEDDSEDARSFVARMAPLSYVPHLFDVEIAEVLLKAVRRKALSEDAATIAFNAVRSLPMQRILAGRFSERLFRSAASRGIAAADARFVEIALNLGLPLVTEDQRLREQCAGFIEVVGLAEANQNLTNN